MEVARSSASGAQLTPGQRVGRYRIVQPLASGGMAEVYLAELSDSTGFSKLVAIKVMRPDFVSSERITSMFLYEARLVARLEHPNLCPVFDFGEVEGLLYLAMEFMNGETVATLGRRLREQQRKIPLGLAARIIMDSALGLHAAHQLADEEGRSLRLVHRDVSPQNLFVLYDSGQARVFDFGIALTEDPERPDVTETHEIKGKVAYMAPEQLLREPLDCRTDVFALGVVAWELLTGARLFKKGADMQAVAAILKDTYPHPSTLRDELPPVLDALVMRALAREPAQRFASALEFAQALEQWCLQAGELCSHRAVAELLDQVCAEDRRSRSELLRRARAERPAERPSGDTPVLTLSNEHTGAVAPREHTELLASTEEATRNARPPRLALRASALVPLVLALTAVLALGLGALASRRGNARVPPPAPPLPATTLAAPPPAPLPLPPAPPLNALAPAALAPPAAPALASPSRRSSASRSSRTPPTPPPAPTLTPPPTPAPAPPAVRPGQLL